MDVRRAAKFMVLGCFVLLGASCGSERTGSSGPADIPDRDGTSTTASGVADGPATPESSIDDPPPVDCPLDEDQVSQAVGAEFERVEAPADVAPGVGVDRWCGFEAATWAVWLSATPLEPQMTSTTAPVPTIEGIGREHFGHMSLDRGGRWSAEVMFTDGRQMFTLTVTNNASGPDTYPPADGPAQRQPTLDAVSALADLLPG